MKTRRRLNVVGAIAVVLLVVCAVGAASNYRIESDDALPLAVVTAIALVVAPAVIVPLILPLVLPRGATVAPKPGVTQFTIAPLEPFTTSVASARWQLGDGSPLPRFGSFARPLVATDRAGITLWKSVGDELPLVTIPAASIRSIFSEEQKIQVSRVGVTGRFFCIVVELMIGRAGVRLILPACTPVGETNPWTREMVDAWAAQMRGITEPETDQSRTPG